MNDIRIKRITRLKDSFRIDWSCDAIGFGQLTVGIREDGSIWAETECLGRGLVKAVANEIINHMEIVE